MRQGRLAAIAIASLVLAFAGGYLVARHRNAPPPARTQVAQPLEGVAGEIQDALLQQDRIQGVHALTGILARTGPEQLAQVRAAFESVFLDVAEIEIVLFAEWWSAFDPRAAFLWAQSSRVANQALVVRSVMRAWARRDPIAASQALGTMLDPVTRRACYDALVAGWEDSGQPGLFEYVHALPQSIEQLRALGAIARRKVLRDGAEGAFAWLETLPDDDPDNPARVKLQLARRIASEGALVDRERTAAWAQKLAGGPYGDGLLGRVGAGWALRDPSGAMAWLATLPEGVQRDGAVEATYRAWLDLNTDAALAWMRSAELQPWLDPAVAQYAVASAPPDPEAALEWTKKIRDDERRRSAVITIGRIWRGQDAAAADAWLERAGIEPDVREQIVSNGRSVAPAATQAPAEAPAEN